MGVLVSAYLTTGLSSFGYLTVLHAPNGTNKAGDGGKVERRMLSKQSCGDSIYVVWPGV